MSLTFAKRVLFKVGRVLHSSGVDINRLKRKPPSESFGSGQNVASWIAVRAQTEVLVNNVDFLALEDEQTRLLDLNNLAIIS